MACILRALGRICCSGGSDHNTKDVEKDKVQQTAAKVQRAKSVTAVSSDVLPVFSPDPNETVDSGSMSGASSSKAAFSSTMQVAQLTTLERSAQIAKEKTVAESDDGQIITAMAVVSSGERPVQRQADQSAEVVLKENAKADSEESEENGQVHKKYHKLRLPRLKISDVQPKRVKPKQIHASNPPKTDNAAPSLLSRPPTPPYQPRIVRKFQEKEQAIAKRAISDFAKTNTEPNPRLSQTIKAVLYSDGSRGRPE